MNYKCQYCGSELKPADSQKWSYSCPNTHVHVRLDKAGEIDAYRFYKKKDTGDKNTVITNSVEQINLEDGRKIIYLNKHSRIPLMVKNRKGNWVKKKTKRETKNILRLTKFFPIKVAEDGTLQLDTLLNKLKMYVVFS